MSMRRMIRFLVAASMAASALCGAAIAQAAICQGRPITILDFRNPSLQSGTALSVGAVYRFSNVATGVDALVRIDALTNATLTIIDRDTGLIPNFQPELGGSNARSADFTISLVAAGGSTPVSADFAASGIDIDGDSAALREYAEFSMPMASFVLETPTNLDVNASGPSVPTNIRFESRTPFTAPGIDPTATGNIVSIQYTSTSSFKYRIGVLGSGSTNRLTSLDFSCPVLNFPTPNPQTAQDFGDAPSSYGDPAHDIVAGTLLGSTITAETSGYNNPTASADSGDDGVALPTFTQGQSGTISAAVTGAGGRLQGWIDWNGDGDFADAGEQVATNIQDNGVGDTNPAGGAISFAVTTPATATTALTFARFRWGTQSSLSSTAIASNGEVEDYAVNINPASGPPSCPAGQLLINQSGNATVQANSGVGNPALALGSLSAAGTTPGPVAAIIDDSSDSLVLDLGVRVPQNGTIILSAARNSGNQGDNARVNVQFSTDNAVFSSLITYGTTPATYTSTVQNILERNNVIVPAGGARYLRFTTQNNDDIFIDGLQYSQICLASPTLTASKTVAIYNPTGTTPFAIPGGDVIYSLTVQNSGSGPVDADSLFIVDTLPPEVTFFNGDMDGAGPATGAVYFTQIAAGLTFTLSTDLKYSNSATRPITFSACAYSPAAGYDANVKHICVNPKGSMQAGSPTSSFTAQFRARIK